MDPPKCCSQIQNISKLAQECCASSNPLKDLAEKRWISLLAYFFAFMPWGIIYAFDFIGDRWKTIHATRREGIFHIIFTLIPLLYVLFYAYLQWITEDHQELSAALKAAVLSIVHVFRTLWGLAQLSVFEDWIFRALRRLSSMGYPITMPKDIGIDDGVMDYSETEVDASSEDDSDSDMSPENRLQRDSSSEDDSDSGMPADCIRPTIRRKFCSEKSLKRIVQSCMQVNNTIVDNVFHGAELPVAFRRGFWKRIKMGSRSGPHQASWGSWLSNFIICTIPEECTIRWSVAFLSQFGASWLKEFKAEDGSPRNAHTSSDNWTSSREMRTLSLQNIAVCAFLQVTKIGRLSPNDSEDQIRSLFYPGMTHEWTSSTLNRKDISKSCIPYNHAPFGDFALSRFKHTITDAKNSWDTRAMNSLSPEEHSAVTGISASQISSFLYVLDNQPITTNSFVVASKEGILWLAREAELSLMEQLTLKNCIPFSELMKAAPVPNESICTPLWENSVQNKNGLILQASAHIDNWLALDTGSKIAEMGESVSWQMENADDELVFEAQKRFEPDRLSQLGYTKKTFNGTPRFLGCIMETVRSIIAEWTSRNKCEDWYPNLRRSVKFSISPQLEKGLRAVGHQTMAYPNRRILMRLLWEAQNGMELALRGRNSEEECAFLCILGFPSLTVKKMSNSWYIIRPVGAPQDIQLLVSISSGAIETRNLSISSGGRENDNVSIDFDGNETDNFTARMRPIDPEANCTSIPFHWQRWKNAFLGRLAAQSEWLNRKELGKENKGLKKASEKSLCEGLRSLSVEIANRRTVELSIWDGWLPRNPQIAYFEFYQVLRNTRESETMSQSLGAVKAALSGGSELFLMPADQPWIEACRSLVEMHEASVAEIGKNNFGKALEGLSFCVKEFADSPSLEKLFQTVFRNHILVDEEVDLLVNSMNQGATLLVNQSNVDRPRTYKTFSMQDLGHIFGQIYSKTKRGRALEYSMAGVPTNSPYVEELKESLNRGIARAHPFLAICFQRGAEREERLYSSDAEAHNQQANNHILQWGKSLPSPEARLSIGFLLEKGSFSGRDTHKLSPLLQCFENEPMAEALIMEHFRFRASLNSLSYPKYESMATNSISESARTKSVSLNRQGLIRERDDLGQAMQLFQSAESQAKKGTDCVSRFIAVNNLGVIFQKQSNFSSARKEFERVLEASQELQGKESWETRAEGRAYLAKTFSPAATAASNLALLMKIESEKEGRQLDLSAREQIMRLYESAAEQGHPMAMYNYAVFLVSGPDRNIDKGHQLLRRVLAIGNELIPMYHFILEVLLLEGVIFDITRTTRISSTPSFEEIDGCLACFKSLNPSHHIVHHL